MSSIDIGAQVRLNAPMIDAHGATATVVQVQRDLYGLPVTAKVQIDGSGETRWLHRLSLVPIVHPLEACE
ncbi:MAG: hypothetical protein VBE63_18295 [Lamprobacter sp.]|uniref:hypothetical protein n=1 Tax=Lamprobacter sp. TaxID=3100796 RepID=UPI002B25AC61|nr:hypothetical protein [Lamprobacter sp.]MEA3641866.1 hypothetical protein [Lamprobacter sp.]